MTAQELKNSILQLAIQGKLVPQNADDEPASELLKRIANERMQRISDGTLIVDKKHTADLITEDDILYDLPDTWKWARFANIVTFNSGKTPQRQNTSYWSNGEYPWVSIADMQTDAITGVTKECISETAFNECFSAKISPAGTMIMSFKLTIGKISILGMDAVHNEAIISIYPTAVDSDSVVLKKYLFKILPLIAATGNSKNAIKGKTLNATSLSNLMIPIPPLAEQERIVAKIEELLPLVAEYDEAEQKLSVLNANFPEMLRKSILQQAVQGKLSERDSSDEPASELLKRIRSEKAKLIAEGKIKKEKPLSSIPDEEKPFDIPDTWEWVRLGAVVSKLTDGSHNPPPNTGKGYPVISAKNVKNGLITFENVDRYTDEKGFAKEHPRTDITKGDIILGIIGGSIGNVAVYTHDQKVIAQRSIAIITTMIDIGYFVYVLNSPLIQNCMQAAAAGSAQGGVYLGTLSNLLLPIPPLAEQKRIVARVNELLAVCDGLK